MMLEVPVTVRLPAKVVLAPDKVMAVAVEDKMLLPLTVKLPPIVALLVVVKVPKEPEPVV